MDLDDDSIDRMQPRPTWVKLGLWGLPNRASAWLFFWMSLAVAAACFAWGFRYAPAFSGTLLVFAALWYYLAIRWVDRNGSWE